MESQVEIIQINIAGKDQPGLTSSLTDILARYDAFILDIGQANIHQSLTLGILIKTTSDKSGAIMKELLFKSSELGINIRFTPISEERYTAWVGMQGKNRYIITLLGRQLTARHIADVAGVISRQGLNIDAIKRMTGRVPLHEDERAPKSCIEFSVRGSLTEEATTAIHRYGQVPSLCRIRTKQTDSGVGKRQCCRCRCFCRLLRQSMEPGQERRLKTFIILRKHEIQNFIHHVDRIMQRGL